MAKEIDLGYIRGEAGPAGPAGPKGDTGPAGPMPHITVGKTTTLAAGQPAEVSIREGSSEAAPILDFAIPAGGSGNGDMSSSVYDSNNRHQDIFSYVDERTGLRDATIVVAAADSQDKSRADFVCEGESDQVTLTEAINSLPAQGGQILLLEGTYILDSYGLANTNNRYRIVNISVDHVTLRGQGSNTVLKLADNVSETDFSYELVWVTGKECAIQSLAVDGNKTNNAVGTVEGIRLQHSADNCLVCDCHVYNCNGFGMVSFAAGAVISRNHMTDCVSGCRAASGQTMVVDNFIKGMSANGIAVEGGTQHIIKSNSIRNSGSKGIEFDSCRLCQCCGNVLIDQPIGIYAYQLNDSTIIANMIKRQEFSNIYADSEYSIFLEECSANMVILNHITGKALTTNGYCNITKYFASSETEWNLFT